MTLPPGANFGVVALPDTIAVTTALRLPTGAFEATVHITQPSTPGWTRFLWNGNTIDLPDHLYKYIPENPAEPSVDVRVELKLGGLLSTGEWAAQHGMHTLNSHGIITHMREYFRAVDTVTIDGTELACTAVWVEKV